MQNRGWQGHEIIKVPDLPLQLPRLWQQEVQEVLDEGVDLEKNLVSTDGDV